MNKLPEATDHWQEVRHYKLSHLQNLHSCLACFPQNTVYIVHTELVNNGGINEWGMKEESWKRNRFRLKGGEGTGLYKEWNMVWI